MSDSPDIHNVPKRSFSGPHTDRRTFMSALGAVAGAAALGGTAIAEEDEQIDPDRDARNVILVIPDGAGQTQISGARYLKAYQEDPDSFPHNIHPNRTSLAVDRAEQVGSMSTYPDDPELLITDSGAAGTALATGTKTYNGAISGIGDESSFDPVETILEAARKSGMATGLVTTTRLTHATPATFATHVPDRGMEDEIARQYVESANVDVLLGGGKRHFDADSREDGADLIGHARDAGYQYVETDSELARVNDGRVLGLFGSDQDRTSHMSYYVDRLHEDGNTEPGLVEMTEKAIELLSQSDRGRENGFFLMVESGRVDHQGHANDPTITAEQLECDHAFGAALDYAESESTPPTLALQVPDHETGGMSLGSDAYDMNWEAIANQHASFEYLQHEIGDAESSDEIADIVSAHAGFEPHGGELVELYRSPGNIADAINTRTQMGWASDSHTAVEVPVYASGPNAEYFGRYFDNTQLAAGIAAALDINHHSCL
ncbi:alkaline phosphatase [Haloferacaceae archaeon DSL9]